MIKTHSNEMKIEREKGSVWFLLGVPMRSVMWNRFWESKWIENRFPSAWKSVLMLPEESPMEARRPLGWNLSSVTLPRRVRTAKPRPPDSKTPAIWDPKIDPEAFQNRFGKRLQNKLAFETDLGPIFDQFSSRWKQIFDPTWKPLLAKWTWHKTKPNSLETM